MANEIWQQEEQKFLLAIQDVKIPNARLENVEFVVPKVSIDLDCIPSGGGCYWIWTTEPVFHALHKNPTPQSFDNGEIIYNGIAKDDVRGRVKHHLFGDVNAGWSGISLDIYFGETVSHRKKALSDRGKVPYIKTKRITKRGNIKKGIPKGTEVDIYTPIRSRSDFEQIYLSQDEKTRLANTETDKIFFRNGIDLTDTKHSGYEFRVYFITGLSSLYLEFIEKNGEMIMDYQNSAHIVQEDNK